MSLTNFSLPIQTVSNTNSQYYLAVQDITQGQTNKEIVSTDLMWKNNSFSVDNVKVQVPTTSNVATTFTTSGTPPRNAKPDDTWYDTASDIIFRYTDDGDGTFQWVDVSGLSNFGDRFVFRYQYDMQYLIVAGGGGGGQAGSSSGGGAAGGGGGVVTGIIPVTTGATVSLSVGAGGAGGTINPQRGFDGTPSTLSSSIATTITAVGGGGGARGGGPGCRCGNPGGSGGGGLIGGSSTQSSQNLGNPTVIQQYGNAGGSNTPGSSSNGQGGGGAGGAGSNGGGPGVGGGAGPGYTYPLTGATYATGGATNPVIWSTPTNAFGTSGGTGTGAGGMNGAGTGAPGSFGGSGGPGTVILAMPTLRYPGSAPGAVVTTPPAAPGMTVLTYTTSSPTTPATFTFTA
jgi:hypothetical protein